MTAIVDATVFLSVGILGGILGSILGIGGGVLMTPFLLLAGYDILVAVPASLLAIVGTSMGGLYVYDEKNLIRYDLAVYAEGFTIPGTITGVMIASAGFKQVMKLTLAVILALISIEMMRTYLGDSSSGSKAEQARKARPLLGYTSMYFAGLISVLAGIGGGVLKVPILTKLLGMDVKEAVATSKLMVGITGAAGALGYFIGGYLNSCLALSLLAGSITGGLIGSKTGARLSGRTIAFLFSIFLLAMSVLVVVRG